MYVQLLGFLRFYTGWPSPMVVGARPGLLRRASLLNDNFLPFGHAWKAASNPIFLFFIFYFNIIRVDDPILRFLEKLSASRLSWWVILGMRAHYRLYPLIYCTLSFVSAEWFCAGWILIQLWNIVVASRWFFWVVYLNKFSMPYTAVILHQVLLNQTFVVHMIVN